MDWHKLQHTLFDLDPTDPREDLAKLQAAAQGGATEIEPTKDYLKESVEVPEGSMPLGIDSVADFAALAGVRINEGKQKDGDYALGKGPMPKAKPGRTKHPLQDKLVGEEEVDEAGVADFVKNNFKQGFDNYNSTNALNPQTGNASPKEKTPTRIMGGNEQKLAALLGGDERLAHSIRKAKSGVELSQPDNYRLAQAFLKAMQLEPQKLQLLANEFRRFKAVPARRAEGRTESIKEELLRKLNAKK